MGKTDMSYYKDLLLRMTGANLGKNRVEKRLRRQGEDLSKRIIGAELGAKSLKPKIVKKKKGGKVK